MPTLVAMALSGETFITRHPDHGTWLHLPEGAGGSGPITEGEAMRAVADHGFVAVDRHFATWRELDDFRQEQAALVAPPVVVEPGELDDHDITELIDIARRWVAQGDGERALRLAIQLLRAPATRDDPQAHETVVSLVDALSASGLLAGLRPDPQDQTKVAARQRWHSLDTAA